MLERGAWFLRSEHDDAVVGRTLEVIEAAMMMVRDVIKPTITVYPAVSSKATGAAVVVCPGGAGVVLDWWSEGTNVAKWLAEHGIAAFVLKYRLAPTPDDAKAFEKFVMEHADENWKTGLALGIADAKQSITVIRKRATEWSINPDRIGFVGFSMGAFVATGVVMNHDPDSRPNFLAAIYGGETAGGTVPSDAPPLFALVAQDDAMMEPSTVKLYSEWHAAKIPAELHVFARGGHGFGTIKQGLPVDSWLELFEEWMISQRLVTPSQSGRPSE